MDAGQSCGNAVCLEIGDLQWRASQASPDIELTLGPALWRFAVHESEGADMTLLVRAGLPEIPDGCVLQFASSGLWSLYTAGEQSCITLAFPGADTPYEVALLGKSLRDGELWVHPSLVLKPVDPWEYPFSELLMVLQLAQGRGVLLHAGALVDEGRAILFVGESGAGKSTMTRLWARSGVQFLSDDRAIVRKWGSTFWAYGTPWHGDAGVASPGKAPLRALFFLQKAASHAVRPLAARDAMARLVVNCFPTFWDREGMAFTLGFLADMVENVPCYELAFARDPGVVDLVRSIV